jgi:hypothetical protein
MDGWMDGVRERREGNSRKMGMVPSQGGKKLEENIALLIKKTKQKKL